LDAHKPSVISEGFVLTGDVVAKGILHIEGRVVGTIRCDSVNIGANGSVDGAIECKSLQIKGTVTGTCMCGELVLASTARVTAKVTYGLLTISRGAKTEGEFVSAGTGLAP
jgi:cytoskeletal protein CcmA (bactofilin family)